MSKVWTVREVQELEERMRALPPPNFPRIGGSRYRDPETTALREEIAALKARVAALEAKGSASV